MPDTQLDRIERKLDAATSLLRTLLAQELLMANDITALSQQIDDATNLIASQLDQVNTTVSGEATAITDLANRVQIIIDGGGVSANVVAQLTAVKDRLAGSASTLGSVNGSLAQHVTTLQGIAADPANPVPGSIAR